MKGFSGFSNLIEAAAKMSGKTVKNMADAMMDGSMMEDQSEKIKEKRIKSSGKSVGKFPKFKKKKTFSADYEPGTIDGKILPGKKLKTN